MKPLVYTWPHLLTGHFVSAVSKPFPVHFNGIADKGGGIEVTSGKWAVYGDPAHSRGASPHAPMEDGNPTKNNRDQRLPTFRASVPKLPFAGVVMGIDELGIVYTSGIFGGLADQFASVRIVQGFGAESVEQILFPAPGMGKEGVHINNPAATGFVGDVQFVGIPDQGLVGKGKYFGVEFPRPCDTPSPDTAEYPQLPIRTAEDHLLHTANSALTQVTGIPGAREGVI